MRTEASICETVVRGGYCIGCGCCVGACPTGALRMRMTPSGTYAPCDPSWTCPQGCGSCVDVCPFGEGNPDEGALAAASITGSEGLAVDPVIGYVGSCVAGSRPMPERLDSASGGLLSELLVRGMSAGLYDSVVSVGPTGCVSPLYEYRVSHWPNEVLAKTSSAYYPVHLADVLETIAAQSGTFAVVGLPCVLKGLRLLQLADSRVREAVTLTAGLVCGRTKTATFTRTTACLCGAATDSDVVRYRVKRPGRPAWDYAFEFASSRHGGHATRQYGMSDGLLALWQSGAFTPRPCFFCDDVFAETADLVAMDAWIPPYINDWRGTTLIVARSREAMRLVEGVADDGLAAPVDTAAVRQSQSGVIQEKRDVLAYRLRRARRRGVLVPQKRHVPTRRVGVLARMRAAQTEWLAGWTARHCGLESSDSALRWAGRAAIAASSVWILADKLMLRSARLRTQWARKSDVSES